MTVAERPDNDARPLKEEFAAYVRVQRSGKFNMIMDSQRAASSAGITRDVYRYIVWHYAELRAEWPEICA